MKCSAITASIPQKICTSVKCESNEFINIDDNDQNYYRWLSTLKPNKLRKLKNLLIKTKPMSNEEEGKDYFKGAFENERNN